MAAVNANEASHLVNVMVFQNIFQKQLDMALEQRLDLEDSQKKSMQTVNKQISSLLAQSMPA